MTDMVSRRSSPARTTTCYPDICWANPVSKVSVKSMIALLTTKEAEVCYASKGAERYLANGTIGIERGRIVTRSRSLTEELRRRIATDYNSVANCYETPLRILTEQEELALSVIPLTSRDDSLKYLEAPVLIILEPLKCTSTSAISLRRMWGLTVAQSELLEALVSGERIGAYAKRNGRSITTAKWHLAAVFKKLGVKHQSDLIRCVLERTTT